jgi:hypothetical protein
METYKKLAQNQKVTIYENQGNQLILLPVNRTYKGKSPVYYLEKKPKGGKSKYISGLFKTQDPASFSGDTQDPITGMKSMFRLVFIDGGAAVKIEGRL